MSNVRELRPQITMDDFNINDIKTILLRMEPDELYSDKECDRIIKKASEMEVGDEITQDFLIVKIWTASLTGNLLGSIIKAFLTDRREVAINMLSFGAPDRVLNSIDIIAEHLGNLTFAAFLVHTGMIGFETDKNTEFGSIVQSGYDTLRDKDQDGLLRALPFFEYCVINISESNEDTPSFFREIYPISNAPYHILPEPISKIDIYIQKDKFTAELKTPWIKRLSLEDVIKYLNMGCPEYFRLENYITKLDPFTESQLYSRDSEVHTKAYQEIAEALITSRSLVGKNASKRTLVKALNYKLAGLLNYHFV